MALTLLGIPLLEVLLPLVLAEIPAPVLAETLLAVGTVPVVVGMTVTLPLLPKPGVSGIHKRSLNLEKRFWYAKRRTDTMEPRAETVLYPIPRQRQGRSVTGSCPHHVRNLRRSWDPARRGAACWSQGVRRGRPSEQKPPPECRRHIRFGRDGIESIGPRQSSEAAALR